MSEYLRSARPSRPQLQRQRNRPRPSAPSPMDLQEIVWALQRCGGSASDARLRDELARSGLTGSGTCRRIIQAALRARLISGGTNAYTLS